MRQRTVGLAGLALLLVVSAAVVLWQVSAVNKPIVTCSLLVDEQRCEDTEATIASFPELALPPTFTGRLTAIDIRAAPPEWATSVDPAYRTAEWAAYLERAEGLPILAACQYSSESMVSCDTDEGPFFSPSD